MPRSGQIRVVVAAVSLWALSHAVTAQQHTYRMSDSHFTLPAGRIVGSTAGITIDRDGSSIWVFERCGGMNCVGSNAAPVLKFDASGKLVKSFGAGLFVRPHGIHIDRDGNV